MQLSRHYATHAFAQPSCKGHAAVSYPSIWVDQRLRLLVTVLELLNRRLKTEVRVLSGYRTVGINARAGGLTASSHLDGWAADLWAPELSPEDLYLELYRMHLEGTHLGGLGLFPAYCHVDVRPGTQLVLEGASDPLPPSLRPYRETLCLACGRPVRLCQEVGCKR